MIDPFYDVLNLYWLIATEDTTRLQRKDKFSANIDELVKQENSFFPSSYLDNVPGVVSQVQRDATKPIYFQPWIGRAREVGSGVVVRYENRNYFVTASHIISPRGTRLSNQRLNGLIALRSSPDRPLRDMELKYSRPQALDQDLPIADVAIFDCSQDLSGVTVGTVTEGEQTIAYALSYPIKFSEEWKRNRAPLVSFGYIEIVPDGEDYDEEFLLSYTGASSYGSSGGGVFSLDGKLLGVITSLRDNSIIATAIKPVLEILS